jgi:hypothetical protein
MAAWGGILALSGFQYDAHGGRLAFAPLVNAADFRCFWSAPAAWGTFSQRLQEGRLQAQIAVEHGALPLGELSLALPKGVKLGAVQVSLGGKAQKNGKSLKDGALSIKLTEPATIRPGEVLTICAGEKA